MTHLVEIHPAILLACEQASTHKQLADDAKVDAERRAHRATMNALNKAAMEMLKGNMPQSVGDGRYLVNSRTNAGQVYQVDVFTQACTCANQHACWHLAACYVCAEVEMREANDGDLLPQGARDLLADDVTALDIAEHVALANADVDSDDIPF